MVFCLFASDGCLMLGKVCHGGTGELASSKSDMPAGVIGFLGGLNSS